MALTNKEYWEQRAQEKFGQPDVMTSNDEVLARLEVGALIGYFSLLPKQQLVAEIGCGSGRIIQRLAAEYPEYIWDGFDLSPTMIKQAQALSIPNSYFFMADMLTWDSLKVYDVIYSVRALTNLASHTEQVAVLNRIQKKIQAHGSLVLLEPTLQGLAQLNQTRTRLGLVEIQQSWFNHYLDLPLILKELQANFCHVEVKHFSSTYCFISRVLNAALAKHEAREIQYADTLNQIAAELDQSICNVSTHIMIIAKR